MEIPLNNDLLLWFCCVEDALKSAHSKEVSGLLSESFEFQSDKMAKGDRSSVRVSKRGPVLKRLHLFLRKSSPARHIKSTSYHRRHVSRKVCVYFSRAAEILQVVKRPLITAAGVTGIIPDDHV